MIKNFISNENLLETFCCINRIMYSLHDKE